MKPCVWFSDCEVYPYDSIWVFKNKRTKEWRIFHNDTQGVQEFFDENPDLWLCGYNFRDYDQYICKGTLLGYSNKQLKELNDLLIFGERQEAWDYLGNDAWNVEVPPIIDLFHDIKPAKSLKEIEANIGMDVKETSVSFDIDRPLTEEELKDCIEYCKHDVEATERLYYLRMDYVRTKQTLCRMCGLDERQMMRNTNARVVSEALHAVKMDPIAKFGVEWYAESIPHWVDMDKLPVEVNEFVHGINSLSGSDDEDTNLKFEFMGIPVVMGLGGIHAATGKLERKVLKSGPRKGLEVLEIKSTPKFFPTKQGRIALIQDIGSFYPSMMILLGYMSRAIPKEYSHLYSDFYHDRMKAKQQARRCDEAGDKAGYQHWSVLADAYKLVLNTKFGCMKDKWNKLYDPYMATCVCLSGQLIILDLMRRIKDSLPNTELVQLNTDGWVLEIDEDDLNTLLSLVDDWSELTGFTVETDRINQLWQRDVNNYVMEFDTGKIKAKGGTVKNCFGGNFRSNNMTIIHSALVEKMIHGVPIEDTIMRCDDLDRFQIILMAGRTYSKCCKAKAGTDRFVSISGKVHRVYAVSDGWKFYKMKCDEGNPAGFPDAPENAIEDFNLKSIDQIDKAWYIDLAYKKYDKFVGNMKG